MLYLQWLLSLYEMKQWTYFITFLFTILAIISLLMFFNGVGLIMDVKSILEGWDD